MKKKIIIVIVVILLIALILWFRYMEYTSIKRSYESYWDIDIPNPTKTEYIVGTGGMDFARFSIMYYSKECIEELKNKDYMKKVDITKLNEIYNTLIEKEFKEFLGYFDTGRFNQEFDKEKLFNERNYYTLLEKGDINDIGYKFNLLILDTKNNKLYSVESYS